MTQHKDSISGRKIDNLSATNKTGDVNLPENLFGMVSVDEIQSPLVAAATTRSYPNGLLGVKVRFYQRGSAAANKEVFLAFDNTAFGDETVPGLRKLVPLGEKEVFSFDPEGPLPTQLTIFAATNEAVLGDTVAYIEAVQKNA